MFRDIMLCSQLKSDVSKKLFASIIRTEEQVKQKSGMKLVAKDSDFLLGHPSSQRRDAT
jgi:hypothetical protein